jgi:hypothetical protein
MIPFDVHRNLFQSHHVAVAADNDVVSGAVNNGDFFNNLRCAFMVILIYHAELWWVVRNPSNRVVQKRKGFNVTEPHCTFDTTNNR